MPYSKGTHSSPDTAMTPLRPHVSERASPTSPPSAPASEKRERVTPPASSERPCMAKKIGKKVATANRVNSRITVIAKSKAIELCARLKAYRQAITQAPDYAVTHV